MGSKDNKNFLPLLREQEAADFLGVSDYWMQKARYLGKGPKFVRVGGQYGRAVRYQLADLMDYVRQNTISTTESLTHQNRLEADK